MDAFDNYRSMDNMIKYMNSDPVMSKKWHLQYSTPSNYIDAIKSHRFPTKQDDLFPYADNPASWWTGYFSSRANAKSYIRRGGSSLTAANQFYTSVILDNSVPQKDIDALIGVQNQMLDAMGIYQHHDAVTGTARQDVANDYALRLHKAMEKNHEAWSAMMDIDMQQFAGMSSQGTFQFCEKTNATYLDCPIANYNLTEGAEVFVAVHNPSTLNLQHI